MLCAWMTREDNKISLTKIERNLDRCSNVTQPGPTVFYLPLSGAKTTPITNEKEKLTILQHTVQ